MLNQKPKNHLAKIEILSSEHLGIFSYRRYDNHLAKREISGDNYQLNYNFNKNDFFDLRFIGAYQKTDQNFEKGAALGLFPLYKSKMMKSQNRAFSFDLSNGLNFDIFDGATQKTRFGVSFLDNEYKRITNDPDWQNFTTEFGMIPQGKQKIINFYLNNSFDYYKFILATNFNLQKFKLNGKKGVCSDDNPLCFPKEAGNFEIKDINLNYSFLASLNLNELFMPFISYSKATRPLNVQEVFTSGVYDTNINTKLKPEIAKTFQIGFNSFKSEILGDDTFGLKMLYYKTNVDNYIYDRYVLLGGAFIARDNGEAKFEGVEIEASYNINYFYINLSHSYQKALKFPLSDSHKIENGLGMGGGQTQFAQLPQSYATLDIGTRLFDEKFIFGSVFKYTGKAKRVDPRTDLTNNKPPFMYAEPKTENLPNIPTIIDLYAIAKPNKNFTLKFEVQNLTDKNYMDALYAMNSNEFQQNNPNYDDTGITFFDNKARGRTYMASFVYKF